MAHRSRLSGFIIDCNTDDHAAAVDFWSQALGYPKGEHLLEEDAEYTSLKDTPSNLYVEVQKVGHPSRVHLDIEADDQDAEVARLEALGAKRVGWVKRWWVMEAPTGQRFCVVKMKEPDKGPAPNQW
ncbi:VOC family protein [Lysobacter sp. A6]|uniref:VOC family protein n=1 Tax=Noviluteimonas lactosilytica TaxID=2888523 RepID=A0ABS8JGQ1_9GAMM|nr:VOC family protein [Lysobacter lactosilyticus]MCC8362771.1 VOC family protein [Lysobacter lactosilyticus]